MQRHPAQHPLIYVGLILICSLWFGVEAGKSFGFTANILLGYGFLGTCLGTFLSILWHLLITLSNL